MIVCNVPGCGAEFETIFSYESHYNLSHRFTCNECKKNLPNSHLLDLHISESHDSYFAVLSEKRPMVQIKEKLFSFTKFNQFYFFPTQFSCYLEECDVKSINASVRRDHCITLHKFPSNFRFDKPLTAKRKQKLIDKQNESMEVSEMEVDCAKTETGKLKHMNFGHQKIPGFYQEPKRKNNKKTSILDTNDMIVDLIESLPT